MKKAVVAFSLLIFLLSLISAEITCSSESDIILRLFSSENSHGALWNDEGTTVEKMIYKNVAPNGTVKLNEIVTEVMVGTIKNINDSNESTNLRAGEYHHSAGKKESKINASVNFASPKNLTFINISRYLQNGGSSDCALIIIDGELKCLKTARENVTVRYSNGTIQTIYQKDWGTASFADESVVNITGKWDNVVEIQVFFWAVIGGHSSGNEIKLKEVYAYEASKNTSLVGYNHSICFSDIFGSVYSKSNPHECGVSNKILKLSADTNAHAEAPSLTNYQTNVCYGDLTCQEDTTSGDGCANGGKVVVRLSSSTNAHLGAAGSNYPVKICCKSSAVIPIPAGDPSLYWANTEGNLITKAQVSDTVKLIVEDSGLPVGESANLIVKDKDVISSDEIITLTGVVDSSGKLIANWTITTSDLKKAKEVGEDFSEFFFVLGNNKSGFLNISTKPADDPIEIKIISPLCGDYFNAGSNVEVKFRADDDDDVIKGKLLVFKGNDIKVEKNFSNGQHTENIQVSEGGNYQIYVEGTNNRGFAARDIVNVMMINTTKKDVYLAACIDKPEDYSNIPSGLVEFDASTTKGIYYDMTNVNVVDYKHLLFNWTFSDGRTNPIRFGGNPLSYRFNKTFSSSGRNWGYVEVRFNQTYLDSL